MKINGELGKVLSTSPEHKQWNCGMGIFKPGVVYWEENPEGRVIIDGKRCKILSKTDYDKNYVLIGGKNYKTVKIGNQVWMVENLDFLPSGIEFVDSGSESYSNTPAACYYDYTNNGLGLLYNRHAVTIIINSTIPAGWRVASVSDWNTLFSYIGGNSAANIKKLKSSALSGAGSWATPGTDIYGFDLRCTGYRSSNAVFTGDDICYFYTDTAGEIYPTSYKRGSISDNTNCSFSEFELPFYSIRLVKDA